MSRRRESGALVTERTARTAKTCGRCGGRIEPGERYDDARLPPRSDGLDNPTWWRMATHPGGSM